MSGHAKPTEWIYYSSLPYGFSPPTLSLALYLSVYYAHFSLPGIASFQLAFLASLSRRQTYPMTAFASPPCSLRLCVPPTNEGDAIDERDGFPDGRPKLSVALNPLDGDVNSETNAFLPRFSPQPLLFREEPNLRQRTFSFRKGEY